MLRRNLRSVSVGRRGGGGVAAPSFNPGLISGLVVDLDARDLTAGAITAWASRVNGYNFTGTGTRDAAINGIATVTGSGNILASTAALSQISGASAITVVAALRSGSNASTHLISELSPSFSANAGAFAMYMDTAGALLNNGGFGNVGTTLSSVADNLTTAAVWSTQVDFALASAEASGIRKNGVVPSVSLLANSNNTGTFGSYSLFLFARSGGTLSWAGSIGKYLLYSRALTVGEMQYLERGIGTIWGVSVA